MNKPEIGQIYYKVSFADPSLMIPRVEPMMFVGENLFPDHEEEGVVSYYFCDPTVNPQSEAKGEQCAVEYYSCTEKGLSGFYTLIEAIANLTLVAAGVDLTRPPGSRGLNL